MWSNVIFFLCAGDSWQNRHENTGVQTQFSACLFITWGNLMLGSISTCHWDASVCLSAFRADAVEKIWSRALGPYFIIVMKERVVKTDAVLLSSNTLYSHGSTTRYYPKTSGKLVLLIWPQMTWTDHLVGNMMGYFFFYSFLYFFFLFWGGCVIKRTFSSYFCLFYFLIQHQGSYCRIGTECPLRKCCMTPLAIKAVFLPNGVCL